MRKMASSPVAGSNKVVQMFLRMLPWKIKKYRWKLDGATHNQQVYQVSELMAAHGYQLTLKHRQARLQEPHPRWGEAEQNRVELLWTTLLLNANTSNHFSSSHRLQHEFFLGGVFFPGIHRESTPIVQLFEVGKMDEIDVRVPTRSHGLKFPQFSPTSQGNRRRSKLSSLSTRSVAFSFEKIPSGLHAGGHPLQIFVFFCT